jgi:hypothetical protein
LERNAEDDTGRPVNRDHARKGFDQAARNVACIAHLLSAFGIPPDAFDTLGFYVLAPREQWDRGVFGNLIDTASIEAKVQQRCHSYDGAKAGWFDSWFAPTLTRITIGFLSWEQLCADVGAVDPVAGAAFADFLSACIRHNRPAFVAPAT